MIKKRVWTQQPQYPAQIDWGNPITKDLAFVDNAATFANAKSVSRNGLCHMAGSLRQKTGITILGSSPTQSGLTLLSIGFLNGTLNGAERQYGIRFGEVNGANFGIGLEAYASNGSLYGQIVYSDYTSTGFTYLPHGVPTNGSPFILGITYARGAVGGLRAFVNGKLFTVLDTSDKSIFPGTTEMEVHSASGTTNNSGYLTTLNLFFKRTLSDEEIASLSANPWQIFRAADSRIFVPTGGTSTATYTIYPTGSIGFNNTTPSIKTNVLSTSGNITYSGTNNLIFSNGATTYTITPSGSISYINSSILKRDRVLYTSGNITYSGTIVTQHTRTLSVNGLITYTGSATNIRIKLINPTGNITYTGTNPIYVPGSGVVTTRLPLTGAGN